MMMMIHMYLYRFQSSLEPMVFSKKNGQKITPNFYYIFLYILMYLSSVASLSRFRLRFLELQPSFKMGQNLKKSLYYSPCFFPKNGQKITPNFYYIFLYILIYLSSVASLSQFRLRFLELQPSFKMGQNLKKSLYYSPCFFPKNGQKITPNFFYIFLYILMYLSCVASLSRFRLRFLELQPSFKIGQNLKKSLYYSPCFFPKNGQKNHPKFLLHFLIHIDVLKLCSKFESIPTSIFGVTAIF